MSSDSISHKGLPPLLESVPHGGPGSKPFQGLDFSVNSNPYGPNPRLLQAVREADYAHYPDPTYRRVREALSDWHAVKPDQVALSTGASDLLHRNVRALMPPGGMALSLHVPFGEFTRALKLAGHPLYTVDDLTTPWPDGTALVYIGYPHNPSGRALHEESWSEWLRRAEKTGAWLLVDEAYTPFTTLPPPPLHPQVIRLHSPGKVHGLVGARPAYALAAEEVVRRLDNLAPAWHVNAGTAALLEQLPGAGAFLDQTLDRVRDHAAQLAAQLRTLGEVEHHGTPFMTLQVGDASRVAAQLQQRGFKVRDCRSYGWPDRIRVSTRLPMDNAQLCAALTGVLESGGLGDG